MSREFHLQESCYCSSIDTGHLLWLQGVVVDTTALQQQTPSLTGTRHKASLGVLQASVS